MKLCHILPANCRHDIAVTILAVKGVKSANCSVMTDVLCNNMGLAWSTWCMVDLYANSWNFFIPRACM